MCAPPRSSQPIALCRDWKLKGGRRGAAQWVFRHTLRCARGIWRINCSTDLAVRRKGGVANASLGQTVTYRRSQGLLAGFSSLARYVTASLFFSSTAVTAAHLLVARGRRRARRSDARATECVEIIVSPKRASRPADHSVLLRETFRPWRRVDIDRHVRVRH